MLIASENMHQCQRLLKGDIVESFKVLTKLVLGEEPKKSSGKDRQIAKIQSQVPYKRIPKTQRYEILSNLFLDKDKDYAKEDIDYLIASYLAFKLKDTSVESVYISTELFLNSLGVEKHRINFEALSSKEEGRNIYVTFKNFFKTKIESSLGRLQKVQLIHVFPTYYIKYTYLPDEIDADAKESSESFYLDAELGALLYLELAKLKRDYVEAINSSSKRQQSKKSFYHLDELDKSTYYKEEKEFVKDFITKRQNLPNILDVSYYYTFHIVRPISVIEDISTYLTEYIYLEDARNILNTSAVARLKSNHNKNLESKGKKNDVEIEKMYNLLRYTPEVQNKINSEKLKHILTHNYFKDHLEGVKENLAKHNDIDYKFKELEGDIRQITNHRYKNIIFSRPSSFTLEKARYLGLEEEKIIKDYMRRLVVNNSRSLSEIMQMLDNIEFYLNSL